MRINLATLTIAVAMASSSPAVAQFNYIAQTRSVAADAIALGNTPEIEDVKSAAAPNFNNFNQSVTAIATVSGTATSSASQNSGLASTTITASGAVSSKGYRFGGNMVGFADSESSFTTTFVLSTPAVVQVTAQLMAHREVTTNFSDTIGSSFFSLIGGSTGLGAMTTIPDGQKDNSVLFSQTVSLLSAGSYTVRAGASCYSGYPNLTNSVLGSGLSSNASYSISVNIVPEPSTIALLAAGGLVLLGYGARRNLTGGRRGNAHRD